jgi:hypothetical protein
MQDAFTSGAYVFTYPPIIEESGHPRDGQEAPVVGPQHLGGASCIAVSHALPTRTGQYGAPDLYHVIY